MQRFLVKVNGREYEVEVEEIDGKSPESKTPARNMTKKNGNPMDEGREVAASVLTTQKVQLEEGRQVKAPLAGNILSIKVKNGERVKRGDVLLTLEALKLENEITSPCDGTVLSINVEVGSSVNTGDVLVIIDEQ